MRMKVMQVMLVVAALLAALGIALALSRSDTQNPAAYEPSGLMESFGGLLGPPLLSPQALTDGGRRFPASLQLPPNARMTFGVAPAEEDQRRASFRISGRSSPLRIVYEVDNAQQFNDRSVDDSEWKQVEAKEKSDVNFVIFDKGGKLIFDNRGSNSSTVTIRIEE